MYFVHDKTFVHHFWQPENPTLTQHVCVYNKRKQNAQYRNLYSLNEWKSVNCKFPVYLEATKDSTIAADTAPLISHCTFLPLFPLNFSHVLSYMISLEPDKYLRTQAWECLRVTAAYFFSNRGDRRPKGLGNALSDPLYTQPYLDYLCNLPFLLYCHTRHSLPPATYYVIMFL